jgi:hypothetical protein
MTQKMRVIFGLEGYVDGNGKICHRTVIVGYQKSEETTK